MKSIYSWGFLKTDFTRKIPLTVSLSALIIIAATPTIPNQAEAGGGLKVIVNGGEGEVCVTSTNADAGCEFANGGTSEFEFSPGDVEVGEDFEVCDDNGCVSHENGPEKAPERVNLGVSGGFGGGGSDDGRSRSDVVQKFCNNLEDGNYIAAEALLTLLDYGTLSAAARAVCGIVGLSDN